MKAQHTGVWFSVPTSLQIPEDLKHLTNECHFIVHHILHGQNCHHHDENGWVKLNTRYLQQMLSSRKEHKAKQFLLRSRIVECNKRWLAGDYSQGYRLAPAYRKALRRIECTNLTLSLKIRHRRLQRNGKPIVEDDLAYTDNCLNKWLNLIEIDRDACLQTLQQVCPETIDQCMMTVDAIYAKEIDNVVDEYGRLHTPLTRLQTDCRKHLRYQASTLQNIDIRNSQMVFFTILFLKDTYHKLSLQPTPSHTASLCYDTSAIAKEGINLSAIPLTQPSSNGTSLCYDTLGEQEKLWVEKVMSGQIYDYLMERAGVKDRGAFKVALFRDVFYGNTNAKWFKPTALTKLFASEFPTIWQFIGQQKKGCYQRLAREMQRQEANFVIGAVCERLCTHHSHIPITTIHDSIMTIPDHVTKVQTVMMEEFKRLGVQPTLKTE
jgi:hypothetical protein